MKIKAQIILPHIYLLTYPTRYELCMSFVRIGEFYESPKFKGKYFTLEQYIDYWCKEFGNGSFTYPSTWNGYNLPSDIFKKWLEMFKDIRPREDTILEKIGGLLMKEYGCLKDNEKYYIIAVHEEDGKESMQHAIEHETAHALYYLYPNYKKICDELIKDIPKKKYENAKKILISMGYCNDVINDELQAYYSSANGSFTPLSEFTTNFDIFKKSLKKHNKKV
jgi:hypothetical protein